jgi:hypothetical protein
MLASVGANKSYLTNRNVIIFSKNVFILQKMATSEPVLGFTHLPTQWVPEVVFLGVKRSERKANHLPPSTAEVTVSVTVYGVELHKASHKEQPLLIYCASPS